MKMRDAIPPAALYPTVAPPPRGQLFRKYVGLFVTVVCAALVANGLLDIWFSYREQNVLLPIRKPDIQEAVGDQGGAHDSDEEANIFAKQLPARGRRNGGV